MPAVDGNLIGTNAAGTVDQGNAGAGVQIINSDGNTIGGAGGTGNVISGNDQYGISIDANSTGNFVQHNLIGTNLAGTAALGNSFSGIVVLSGSNTIGGTATDAGNAISGNLHHGVWLNSATATGNLVQGNYIGLDMTGTADVGNVLNGVQIDASAATNTIGGTTPAAGNVISGNNQNGVFMTGAATTGNLVQGNYIGTNEAGTGAVANTLDGVLINGSPSNTIGGTAAGAGNVISGNSRFGVEIVNSGSTGNLVQGNLIGTNAAGTGAVGNTKSGVVVFNAASNTVGGTAVGSRNMISGNGENGVFLGAAGATGNLVQGNYIGTDITGAVDLGNTLDGVLVNAAPSNTIGGTAATARNVISGNNRFGIQIISSGATGNLVQGNYIGTNAAGTGAVGNSLSGIVVFAEPAEVKCTRIRTA